MTTGTKGSVKRKRQKRAQRRRGKTARTATAPAEAGAQQEEFFDEPATPPRQPITPVEEPIRPPQRMEDEEACGLPETPTPASYLH